jgi:hypothetical protein
MKVIIELELDDAQRAAITAYYRKVYSEKGLPKLATRQTIKRFVNNAIDNQWLHLGDELTEQEGRR